MLRDLDRHEVRVDQYQDATAHAFPRFKWTCVCGQLQRGFVSRFGAALCGSYHYMQSTRFDPSA